MSARTVSASIARVFAIAVALIGFIAATNVWVSWHYAIYTLRSFDDLSYRAMAAASPGLLHTRIPEWHAERFAVEWVVGGATKLFDISLDASFRVGDVIVILAICLVLAEVLIRIQVSVAATAVCVGVFVLNAYTVRPALIAPGGIPDLVFTLGITIAARGLVLRSSVNVLGGLLLATIARQTALPAAVVAAAAVLLDPAWRARLGSWRVAYAVSTVVLPVACYAAIRVIADSFSGPSPSLHTITLLGADLSPSVLVQHFARCINPLLSVAGLLIGVWWWMRRQQSATGERAGMSGDARRATYACLALGAAVVLQPAALNPAWATYNETRLSVLGLTPFIVALGVMFGQIELGRARAFAPGLAAILLGLLAVASLHHIYSVIGGSNKWETLVLEALVAVALAAALQYIPPRRDEGVSAKPQPRAGARAGATD